MGEFLKARSSQMGAELSQQDARSSAIALAYPCLHEWLTLTRWEDGSERITATLTAFVEDGRWKLCLSDRDQQRVTFVSGWTMEDALHALEEGLLGCTLDWRVKAGGSGPPRKRT